MPDGSFVSQSVKLTLQTLREEVGATIYADSQGQFEFSNLTPGNYKIEVDADPQRFEVFTQSVQVFRGVPSVLTLNLKEKLSAAPRVSGGNVVSTRELERDVPAKARKEFEKASHSAEAGKTDEAIVHLRKAISLYPDYLMAYNDLGTCLMAQGKLEAAGVELRRAVSLDDKAFNPALNLGIVLVHQGQFAEAAKILGKALPLEPTSPAVHLYLGLAASGLGSFETADRELRAAYSLGGSKYAIALVHLGQLYMNKADRDSALKFLDRYLQEVPNAANADQVRRMIAVLRNQVF
jgi:tetratricopeptide (TPR) repeat protein